jgi:adenylate cyclase
MEGRRSNFGADLSDERKTLGARFAALCHGAWTKAPGLLGGIVLSAGVGFILLTTSLGHGIQAASYDLPFQWRPTVYPNEVEMVYLDDASYEQLRQKYTEPWNRALLIKLLQRLTTDGASAVVFDIVFSDALDPATDQQFAEAMSENGKVIIACDWRIAYYNGRSAQQAGRKFTLPLPLFNEHAVDIGASALFPEAGEYIREYRPTIPNEQTNTLAWATALLVKPSFNESNSLRSLPFWMNYYGPENALPSVSLYKAIAADDPNVPPGFFRDKVVFVGAKLQTRLAPDRKDEYSTPYSYRPDDKWMSGVAIHATAFLNLIRGDYLREFPWWINRVLILALGVLFGGGLVLCRPLWAVVIGLLPILPVAYANYYAFDRYHYWFPWLIVVAVQIPVAIVWAVTYNSVRLHVEKRLIEQSLALYLSPALVKKFAANPKLMKRGAEKQLLTILFTDIADFTAISEGMDSDELARLMNAYFQGGVQNCIHATDGTVVKYIGDAIFAFWNAPDPQGDHAYRACEAALRFRSLSAERVHGRELITRLGLHTGVANVGNFGSDKRFDYTAIGENINLASRMEGLNKYLGTRVLITGETQKEVAARLVTRYLGLFRLKGFEKAVAVYELISFLQNEAESRVLRERFADALRKFAKKEFAGAEESFRSVQEISPKDGPTSFYLEQIPELSGVELPPEWNGEITLKDK